MFRRNVIALLAGGCALGFGLRASDSRAQGTSLASEAANFILNLSLQAFESLVRAKISDAQRNERFRALLNAAFDVPLLAQFALGRYWRAATEAERQDYLKLFEDTLVINYASRFKDYTGETLRILQTRGIQPDEALVNTELPRPGAAPVRVGWRVHRAGSALKVVDVIVEGVSMAVTQRDDYAALIQRAGGRVSALLAALREKISPSPENPAPTRPPPRLSEGP